METICCPNCGFYQVVENNYCLRCGVNMFLFAADHSVVMMCPECREVGDGNHCKGCGTKLIGRSICRRRKILSVVYLIIGVGLVCAGGYWVRNTWIGLKAPKPRAETVQNFAQIPSRRKEKKISPRKSPQKTVGKLKGLAKGNLTEFAEKEEVSKGLTNTAAKKPAPKKQLDLTQTKRSVKIAVIPPPPPVIKEKPIAEVKKVKEADPLEDEDLFKRGLLWFENEIPKLRAQGLVDRVEESDPFVVYVYWAKWRYLSRRRQRDLLNRVKTARENMDFDEVVEFRDANSRELLISTSPSE